MTDRVIEGGLVSDDVPVPVVAPLKGRLGGVWWRWECLVCGASSQANNEPLADSTALAHAADHNARGHRYEPARGPAAIEGRPS